MPIILALLCVLPIAMVIFIFFSSYLLFPANVAGVVAGLPIIALPIVMEEVKAMKRDRGHMEIVGVGSDTKERWFVDWASWIAVPFGFYIAFLSGSIMAGGVIGWNLGLMRVDFPNREELSYLMAPAKYSITFCLIALYSRLIALLRPHWSIGKVLFFYTFAIIYLSILDGYETTILSPAISSWIPDAIMENIDLSILTTSEQQWRQILIRALGDAFLQFPAVMLGPLTMSSRTKGSGFLNLFESLDSPTQSTIIQLMKEDLESRLSKK